eukprot:274972-Lingulodinium_polyedra.AAC.1
MDLGGTTHALPVPNTAVSNIGNACIAATTTREPCTEVPDAGIACIRCDQYWRFRRWLRTVSI